MTNRKRSDETIHERPDVFGIQPDNSESDCQGSFEGRGKEKDGFARFVRTQPTENIIILTTGLAPGLSAVDTDIVLLGDNDIESESKATCRDIEHI